MTAPSTLEQPGDLREHMRESQAYEDAIRNFYAAHPDLEGDFPDKWIAVYRDQVLARDTFDDLLQEVDRRGIPRASTFIRFVDREPTGYVFQHEPLGLAAG